MPACTSCLVDLPAGAFYPRGDGRGLRSRCKSCSRRSSGQKAARRRRRGESPESALLSNMIQRCHNSNNPNFPNYGGRGIDVCDRWRESLANFVADMGERPSSRHSIERIDNDGHYEPRNCRWATRTEQNRNTRQNVKLTIEGVTRCRSEWSEVSGVPANAIRDRMEKLGWPAKRSVFEPINTKFGPRRMEAT